MSLQHQQRNQNQDLDHDHEQDQENNTQQEEKPASSNSSSQTTEVTTSAAAAAAITTTSSSTYKILSAEISEALEKIQANPEDPNGYVLAGKLYSCQGNQQEAITVLEQGLRAVPADHYITLQQRMDAAKSRRDGRIDFISHCPYELVCNIAMHMDTKTAIHCLGVCRSWRYKLLSCHCLWRDLTLNGSGKMTMVRQAMSAVSKDIVTLRIKAQPGKINRYLNALKAMGSGKVEFANLQSLAIRDNGENIEADLSLSRSLYSALPGISNTLVRLTLDSQSFVAVSLGRLLSICRNLKYIHLNIYSLADASRQLYGVQNKDTSNSNPILLETLSIICRWPMSPILMESLGPLFPYLPHLRRLVILYHSWYVSGDDLLTILGDHCPKLEEIRYGSVYVPLVFWPESRYDDDDDGYEDDHGNDLRSSTRTTTATRTTGGIGTEKEQQHSGLRYLIVDPIRSARRLSQRLSNSRDTLQRMSLAMDELSRATTVADWRPFSSFTMHQMTHLEIYNGCLGFYQQLPDMLRCFPCLEWLHLEINKPKDPTAHPLSTDAEYAENLLQALVQLTKLSTLHMDNFYILDQAFYERLMEHYVMVAEEQEIVETGVGQRAVSSTTVVAAAVSAAASSSETAEAAPVSSLDVLRIIECDGFTCQALLQAAKIKSLRSFTIELSKNRTTQEQVTSSTSELIHLLGDLPLLCELELGNMQLSNLGHLVGDVLQSKTNLKSIVLKNVQGLTRQDTELLREYESLSIQ